MNKKIYHRGEIGSIMVELIFLKTRLDRYGYDESRIKDMIFTKSDFEWSLYETR